MNEHIRNIIPALPGWKAAIWWWDDVENNVELEAFDIACWALIDNVLGAAYDSASAHREDWKDYFPAHSIDEAVVGLADVGNGWLTNVELENFLGYLPPGGNIEDFRRAADEAKQSHDALVLITNARRAQEHLKKKEQEAQTQEKGVATTTTDDAAGTTVTVSGGPRWAQQYAPAPRTSGVLKVE